MEPVESSVVTDMHARGHDLIKTVVLVDAPHVTAPVGQFLRELGWTVYEASNCGQARGLITRYKPDFVIMELLLPLETGFEFCAYLKKADCRIPVMIFTEVTLEEARNLAIWSGADAYVTKPTDPMRLYRQILAAAERVSYRVRALESGFGGSISFHCKCGKPLRVGSKHAGRAVICPACQHLAKCPESSIDTGTLFRSLMEERQGLRTRNGGVVCPACSATVDPHKCRVRDHFECPHCNRRLSISTDFLEQWHLFFEDQAIESPISEVNPLLYVYVQCESCRNLHQYFRDADNPQPCPSCNHQHSLPSIRGVPISRAALASTGRLFEFRFNDGKTKLFLLPSRRKWMVGSSAECPIALRNQPLQPRHCYLKNSFEGPRIAPASVEAKVRVNDKFVTSETLLRPGDNIQVGGIALHLFGTSQSNLRRRLEGVLKEVADRKKIVGELELAEPAARVLQYHWEILRFRWVEHLQRQQQHAASSESSLIQQIPEEHLL